ncbi:MAG: ComEC/Rec2 family competence protein [Opitutaceae bacterium]
MRRKIKALPVPAEAARIHRAPLLWLVLPFMGGLAAGGAGLIADPRPALICGTAASVAALIAAGRHRRLWAVLLCASLFPAGNAAYAMNRPHRQAPSWRAPPAERLLLRVDGASQPKSIGRTFAGGHTRRSTAAASRRSRPGVRRRKSGRHRTASASGHAGSPPRVRAGGFARILSASPDGWLAGQRIYYSLTLAPGQEAPIRTALVEASGRIKTVPRDPPADSFFGYLAGLGVGFELSPGRLGRQAAAPSSYARFREALATRMSKLLGRGFESRPDLAAIYRAMMLGRKGDLSAEQKRWFIASGTMHLFAINGLHIGIVALSLHALLALLRCPRPLAAALVLGILWLDVDSTGASSSAVRAFLMIAAIEAGHALQLPANPLSALAGAAAVVLAVRPFDFFGASFRMSFSVVLALLTLGVPLAGRWSLGRAPAAGPSDNPDSDSAASGASGKDPPRGPRPHLRRAAGAAFRHLRAAAAFCTAATAISAISGVEYFSVWAPSGFVANLALMPPATLVIVSGFAAIVCGLLHLGFAVRLFNGAALVLLRIIAGAIHALSVVPEVCLSAHFRAGWIGPVALAAAVASCLAGYATGWSRRWGGWWPPFLIAAATLAAGVRYG